MRFWKPRTIVDNPRVGVAVAAYVRDPFVLREGMALRCLVSAFLAQTYENWRLDIVHDGPVDRRYMDLFDDVTEWGGDKLKLIETAERKQQFGHPHRQASVDRLLSQGCDWILHTNQDNYYVPVFLEWMLSEAQKYKAPFVYCDFVRSHKQWAVHTSKPKKGHLDLGAFLAHKSLVTKIKFDKFTFEGDGDYINRLVAAAKHKVAKVAAPLFVHN